MTRATLTTPRKIQPAVPFVNEGRLIVDYDDIANFNVNSGEAKAATINDSVNFIDGTGSIKSTVTELENYAQIAKQSISLDLSADDTFTLWFYAHTVPRVETGVDTVFRTYVYFSSQATTFSDFYTTHSQKTEYDYFVSKGWNAWTFSKSEMTSSGSPDWSDIQQITLRAGGTGAQTDEISLSLDGLYAGTRTRAKINISFDDGNETNYTEAFTNDLMQGFSGTSFIMSDIYEIGSVNGMTLAESQEMYAAGWEFCNHGKEIEHYTDIPGNIDDYVHCKTYMSAQGLGANFDLVRYQSDKWDEAFDTSMRNSGHFAATSQAADRQFPVTMAVHPTDNSIRSRQPWKLIELGNTGVDSTATIIAALHTSIQVGGFGSIVTHVLEADQGTADASAVMTSFADFTTVITEIKRLADLGVLDVVPYRDIVY